MCITLPACETDFILLNLSSCKLDFYTLNKLLSKRT